MKYFIIAGEASGDLHGANLMKSLKLLDQEAGFVFLGGNLMLEQGGKLLKHYRDMAFMGAIDVIQNLGKIKDNFSLCRQQLMEYKPDVVILIDYPGFNLKIAEFATKSGFTVFYYILPKVWAWKEWRVKALKSFTSGLFSIFPFEIDFFAKYGVKVHYVGNPLLDAVSEAESNPGEGVLFTEDVNPSGKKIVALLPGSRTQEIKMMLPVMTRLAKDFPDFQFVISGTEAVDPALYSAYSVDLSIPVVFGKTYGLLKRAHAAIVTSGTATLETALFQVPQIVLYKMAGGKLGYKIFRFLFLKVKFVSLPNLILNRCFLREFVMDEMKYSLVRPETEKLIRNSGYRKEILTSYEEIKEIMGEKGASDRAASRMIELLHAKKNIK
jgi:lipid-A-disaccharide synthase